MSIVLADKVCEIPGCGAPAIGWVQDLIEVAPSGMLRQFERFGEPHLFCDRHYRGSVRY